ncbi:MAG: sulfite exporter TauE/SafE family protein [Planctomycetales bacterium]|nr:sulfite exporter TauE/SafE family protein [Planctomycetales bacterium]
MLLVFAGALVIGLTLGMLGSGGSAITVPVLIYVVGHGTKESMTESMAIVGLISIAAAIPYARAHQIDWRSVWYFGVPGMLGTFVGAWFGGNSAAALQLVVFGVVLIAAAASMIRRPKVESETAPDADSRSPLWKIILEGTAVGVVTGFVGVGGGFLIVPALVVLGKLPMRLAIGTSLVIIAIKAAVGFAKYEHYLWHHNLSVDVQTVLVFTIVGVAGSILGRQINRCMNQLVLRRVFAAFLVLLGCFMIIREGSQLWMRTASTSHVGHILATSESEST